MKTSKRTLHIVAGPTASGKSRYALDLAHTCNGVIINADSLQVYTALPTITAQPTAQDIAQTPHHLYNYVGPTHRYDVQQWIKDVQSALANLTPDQTPILVGGTGLYVDSFCYGISEMPIVPRETILKCEINFSNLGPKAFHAELANIDPETALRLHPNDRQRLIRAMSICIETGLPFSQWQQKKPSEIPGDPYVIRSTILFPPRETLRERSEKRFLKMIGNGAIEEVEELLVRHAFEDLSPTLSKAIGVVHIRDYLTGNTSKDDMIRLSVDQTNQYLKRQTTWFRNRKLPNLETRS